MHRFCAGYAEGKEQSLSASFPPSCNLILCPVHQALATPPDAGAAVVPLPAAPGASLCRGHGGPSLSDRQVSRTRTLLLHRNSPDFLVSEAQPLPAY